MSELPVGWYYRRVMMVGRDTSWYGPFNTEEDCVHNATERDLHDDTDVTNYIVLACLSVTLQDTRSISGD